VVFKRDGFAQARQYMFDARRLYPLNAPHIGVPVYSVSSTEKFDIYQESLRFMTYVLVIRACGDGLNQPLSIARKIARKKPAG